jgi:hypothetical protein
MVFAPAVLQAEQLASYRPAQWWSWAAARRRAEVRWTLGCSADELLRAVRTHAAPSGLDRLLVVLHHSLPQPPWGPFTMLTDQPEEGRMVMLCFSPILQFLDVVELTAVPAAAAAATPPSPPPLSPRLRSGRGHKTPSRHTPARVGYVLPRVALEERPETRT